METSIEARFSLSYENFVIVKPKRFSFARVVVLALILTVSGAANYIGPVCANPGALVPPAFSILPPI